MSSIVASYELTRRGDDAVDFARMIAFEQTVELPEAIVRDDIRDRIVGEVLSVEPHQTGSLARIAYHGWLAAGQLPQLLNLVYGNASMYRGVRLKELELPAEVLASFPGPQLGISGVRELTGAHGRPLLATALKPTGLTNPELADMAGGFARGGGDLIKDDQNLVDASVEDFEARVGACAEAVASANARGGHRCQYWPHVAAPHGDLQRQLEIVRSLGLTGVLMSPIVHGLEQVRGLLSQHHLGFMAHPSLTGGFTAPLDHGIAHHVLLGTLFRVAGADISVFPNFGGRFAYDRGDCLAIRDACLDPLGDLRPAFPCPAGGMQFTSLSNMSRDFGTDAVFLVGGALHGHASDLAEGTRAFREEIERLNRA